MKTSKNVENGINEHISFDMGEVFHPEEERTTASFASKYVEASSDGSKNTTSVVVHMDSVISSCQKSTDINTNISSTVADSEKYINIYNICSKNSQLESYFRVFQDKKIRKYFKIFTSLALTATYLVYFVAVLLIPSKKEEKDYWCDGDGSLIVMTAFFGLLLVYFKVLKPICSACAYHKTKIYRKYVGSFQSNRKIATMKYIAAVAAFVVFLVIDTWDNQTRLVSGFGLLVFIGLSAMFSLYPTEIKVDQIVWGIGLQVMFGLLIMRWSVGRLLFECVGSKVATFLSFTDVGTLFAIGDFLNSTNSYLFKILPVILFFGFFVSVLYYFGIMQWVIAKLGWTLEVTMGITPCEGMATVANIFLGQSEAPLVIRPYISKLTKSELHTIATGGFATVAGGILAAYISFGIKPSHLMIASIMSAPAAVTMSKILYPEIEKSSTNAEQITFEKNHLSFPHALLVDLKANIPLIANIGAVLIVSVSVTSFCNSVFDWGCQLIGYEEGVCSVQVLLGYPLYPVAWLMGISSEDCYFVGYLLGTKIFATEFLAYKDLGDKLKLGLISDRSAAITTYALCGFSSVAGLGCQILALSCYAPSRTKDISAIMFRAFIAGNLACVLTACVAAMFLEESDVRMAAFNITVFQT